MVKFATMKDLKERTPWVLREAKRGNGIVLTLHGRPAALLQPLTEEELDAFVLSQSKKVKKLLKLAWKQVREGKVHDLEDVLEELERKS